MGTAYPQNITQQINYATKLSQTNVSQTIAYGMYIDYNALNVLTCDVRRDYQAQNHMQSRTKSIQDVFIGVLKCF